LLENHGSIFSLEQPLIYAFLSHFDVFWCFLPIRIPDKIPLRILHNATLFPESIIRLHIFECRYRRMLPGFLKSRKMFTSRRLSNPLHRQIMLESLNLKTRLENIFSFVSVEIEHKK